MTDYKALCYEVLAYHEGQGKYNFSHLNPYDRENAAFDAWQEITAELKHALAQPEPEEPTDDKLMDIARATDLVYYMGEDCGFASPYMEETDITAGVLAFARAVLARWGTSNLAQVRSSLVDHQPLVENDVDLYLEQ